MGEFLGGFISGACAMVIIMGVLCSRKGRTGGGSSSSSQSVVMDQSRLRDLYKE